MKLTITISGRVRQRSDALSTLISSGFSSGISTATSLRSTTRFFALWDTIAMTSSLAASDGR
jgi:hypothetical protein